MDHPTAGAQDAADFIQHPKLAELFRTWRGLSRDGLVPRRRDIDPLQLGPSLKHMQLLDLGPTPDDLRYRLVGQTIIDAFGFDPRHLTRGEIRRRHVRPENLAAFDETSRQTHAIGTGAMVAYTHDHRTSYARDFLSYARLLLPISEDGRAITGVFGAIYYSGDRDDLWCGFQELHVEVPIAAFGIGVG